MTLSAKECLRNLYFGFVLIHFLYNHKGSKGMQVLHRTTKIILKITFSRAALEKTEK